ncbi:NfeD family protein [Natranaerofaba carboxydovora]|uniref:NfeD family protein n=1 Tax=Natranaerofaba carboxydovora TaxID=2742683 RepID=UPI001F1458B8|nr:nodulation protein NfeD [Natranaerofaba carboxydovora]UMZ72593.1 hypothetical protein ACONDI_00117 [Natranaerofaba carboxydovora]
MRDQFRLMKITVTLLIICGLLASSIFSSNTLIANNENDVVNTDENSREFDLVVIPIEGTITAGTTNFLESNLEKAIEGEADAVLLKINTPGGLVDATMDIIEKMLNSPTPIITYVSPSGAIAASAGSLIMSAGHIAAMAPGTTVGAAMPVTMAPTGEEPQQADEKTVNFLAEYAESIARERGRPENIARRFVTENLTLSDSTAEEKGFIDVRAANMTGLLEMLDEKEITVNGEDVTLLTENANIKEVEMDTRDRLIHFVSNPQIAFLLFLIGLYGIIFGLNMPGTFIPEVGGAIALILALFGLGMFEVNTLGLILIVLSVAFFIIEVFTPTFGVMTTFGVITLIIGGLMLPFEPMLPTEWFRAFRLTVIGMGLATGGFFFFVIAKVVKLRKKEPYMTKHGMLGYTGKVIKELAPEGLVKIRGELWRARSKSGEIIPIDVEVTVKEEDGIVLVVDKIGKNTQRED